MRLRRLLAAQVIFGVTLVACGPRRDDAPRNGGAPPPASGPGCGVNVGFYQECESVIDSACCPQQAACAQDPVCAGYMGCREQCKIQWLRGAKGDGCILGCMQQYPGIQSNRGWGGILSCTAHMRYPAGARCDTPF